MKNQQAILINPPISLEDRYGKDMKNFGALSEPLGIAYIAGYIEPLGFKAVIIDAPAESLDVEGLISKIHELVADFQSVIGISVLTTVFQVVKTLCARIRAEFPDITIVLGGPHCTALPERTLFEIKEADIACVGEGELIFAEIMMTPEKKDWQDIKGICFRNNKGIVRTQLRDFIKNIDEIPPPARHLLPMSKYHLTVSRVAKQSSYCPTIIVARGCPFKCTYCSRTFGKSLRMHSIARIISEILMLIEYYDVKQINIEADTLTANKRFLNELCQALIDNGLNKRIKWTCESRVDTVDEESLRLMKRAGCWQISYGVETGNQRLLDQINKSVTIEQIKNAFALAKKMGITVRGFFMLGLPSETREESINTINFAKELDPLWAQFTITVPYPGTKMFDDLRKSGEIKTLDWSLYNTWSGWKGQKEIPYVTKGRTIEELSYLQKYALRNFYLRPRVFIRFVKTIGSLSDIKKYIQGFIVLLKSKI